MVLLALGSNGEFKYPRYFQSAAFGPDSKGVLSNNFFEVAKTLKPEPKTVALVGADAEFSNNVLIGARQNAKKFDLKIVYDRSYPPSTVDFTPIVRAVQATTPDVVLIASYPPDSVGLVRAATELGLKAQLFGGAMVGMQYASLITQLGDKVNRVVNYHLYVPSQKMNFPGIEAFLKKYQAQAKDAEHAAHDPVDPDLGAPVEGARRPAREHQRQQGEPGELVHRHERQHRAVHPAGQVLRQHRQEDAAEEHHDLGIAELQQQGAHEALPARHVAGPPDGEVRQRVAGMAPQHHREIEQIERAADAEGDVQPFKLREQGLQAVKRRRSPQQRAHHHGERREQAAAPPRDGGGLDHQHGRGSGTRHCQQMDGGETDQDEDVLHA